MEIKNLSQGPALYDSLASYFCDVRKLKGLGLPTIAEVTGFHTSNLSRIERSMHKPTPDTLDRLCVVEAYGCPWWIAEDNMIFLRALAYHLTESPAYVPRLAEWWPPDMVVAGAAAEIIASSTTWSHGRPWQTLVEIWPALHLPWQPTQEWTGSTPPALMRPMWLWGSWATTQEIETHSDAQIAWYQHISHRDTRALAAVVMGHILEEVAQFQDDRSATEPTTWPRDSDFRAIAEIWPTLSAPHQRLAKELILAMSSRPS